MAIGIGLACALGCRLVNESHCANLAGDETCRERDEARRWCSACTADHDGCVDEPVVESECLVDAMATTDVPTSTGTTASSTTVPATSSTNEHPPATTSDGGSSDETGFETTAASTGTPGPTCGDGIAQAPETCDGDDLGGISCETLGLMGGTLACNPDCATFDTAGCRGVAVCGNGVVEGNERCDGDDLGGASCAALAEFSEGELACDDGCELDTSGCQPCVPLLGACDDDDACCSRNCTPLGTCE
jgi:hypothetical protein